MFLPFMLQFSQLSFALFFLSEIQLIHLNRKGGQPLVANLWFKYDKFRILCLVWQYSTGYKHIAHTDYALDRNVQTLYRYII